MARCEGTTRSGAQCKLDARPGSRFCHLHGGAEEDAEMRGTDAEAEAVEDTLEWEDIFPLFLAGVAAAGLIFFLRSFGRWIPRP
ncbi:MAG: hypothetical protein PVJ04_11500 [Gemmatimonadota bacterium]|jgi:hypothetical protein